MKTGSVGNRMVGIRGNEGAARGASYRTDKGGEVW